MAETTNFLNGMLVDGVPTMGMSGLPVTRGQVFFVDYVNGGDGNPGTASAPMKTVYRAHAAAVAGRGDVVAIVSDGSTTGTQRLSLANAQAVTSSATVGTLVWSKNNTHLVGVTAPSVNPRARFAPPSGTYTVTTFGSANFIRVTAAGCIFANFSVFNGFSTGGASQIAWTDTGGRNYYNNVQFGGMGDAGSAQDAGSRSLKISGSGESVYDNCIIGLDTVTRTVANASLEFAAGTARNMFRGCTFPMIASNAGVLSILGTGNACVDRFQLFKNCWFINAMDSTATAQTAIASFTTASPGGSLIMDNCAFIGNSSTNWGDANAMANMYVMGASPTDSSNGNAVNPS